MPPLRDQVVLITGASSGIGDAVARRLVRGGAHVVLFARREDRLSALARELDGSGRRVLAVTGDVTSDADRRRLVDSALAAFGRIDALVNNAGYGTRGPVERVPVDLIRRNYETNVFSLVALTQLVLPGMRAQRSGCIVNIGSVAGRIARPLSSVYDSTKHALEALTDGLRGELKPFGVRVTLVRPGFILTEFVEAAREASAEAVSDAGPYEPYLAGFSFGHRRFHRLAGAPDDVARCVERALASDNPPPRYATPGHAHLFLLLKWLLPDRLVQWVVRLRAPRV